MIRSILISTFLLFSICQAHGQNENNAQRELNYKMAEAGMLLKKHSSQFYLGVGLQFGGLILVAASPDDATIGGIAVLVGTVVQIFSHRHIGKAGRIMSSGNYQARVMSPVPKTNFPSAPQQLGFKIRI